MIQTQDPQDPAKQPQSPISPVPPEIPIPNPADEQAWFEHLVKTFADYRSLPEADLVKRVRAHALVAKRVLDVRDAKRALARQQQAAVEQQVGEEQQAQAIAQQGDELGQQISIAGERLPDMREGLEGQLRVLTANGLDEAQQRKLVEQMDRQAGMVKLLGEIDQRLGGALKQALAGERQANQVPPMPMGPGIQAMGNVGAGLLKGATMGMAGETTFRGRSIAAMLDAAQRIEQRHFPPPGPDDMARLQKKMLGIDQLPQGMTQEMLRGAITERIGRLVEEKVAPLEPNFSAQDFQQEVGNLLGWLVPYSGAAKGAKLALGAKKLLPWAEKALTEFAAPTATFMAHGYAGDPAAEDQIRIREAGERGPAVEQAIRLRNMVVEGASAPISMGAAGILSGATKSPVLRGLGMGAAAPAITEASEAALGLASKAGLAPEVVRDFYAAQGHYGAIDRLINAKTGAEAWDAAKVYAKQAAVGMTAFGALGAMQRTGRRFDGRDELMAARREVEKEAQAKLEPEVAQEVVREADKMLETLAPPAKVEERRVATKEAEAHGVTPQDVRERTMAKLFPDIEGGTLQEKRDAVAQRIDQLQEAQGSTKEIAALEAEWEAMRAFQKGKDSEASHLMERARAMREGKPEPEAPTPEQAQGQKLAADIALHEGMPKAVAAEVKERTGKWRITAADHARDLVTLTGPEGETVRVRSGSLAGPKWAGRLEGEMPADPMAGTVQEFVQRTGEKDPAVVAQKLGLTAPRAKRLMAGRSDRSDVSHDKPGDVPEPDRTSQQTDQAIQEAMGGRVPEGGGPASKPPAPWMGSETGAVIKPTVDELVQGARVVGNFVREQITGPPSADRFDVIHGATRRAMRLHGSSVDFLKSALGDWGDIAVKANEFLSKTEQELRFVDRVARESQRVIGGEDAPRNKHIALLAESRSRRGDPTKLKPEEQAAWAKATPEDIKLAEQLGGLMKKIGPGLAERQPDAIRMRQALEFYGDDVKAAHEALGAAQRKRSTWNQNNPEPAKKTPAHKAWIKGRAAVNRAVTLAEKEIKTIHALTVKMKRSLERFVERHQRVDYLPHVSKEPDKAVPRNLRKTRFDILSVADTEPAHQISKHMLQRKGALEAKGERDPDIGRSLYHYLRDAVVKANRTDFLLQHEGAIWGERKPLSKVEVVAGSGEPTFARLDPKHPLNLSKVVWHGLFYEVKDAATGKLYYTRSAGKLPKGDKVQRRVALIDSRGPQAKEIARRRFASGKKVQKGQKDDFAEPGYVQANQYLQVHHPSARHRVFKREGGLLSALTAGGESRRAERLREFVNRVLGQDLELLGVREDQMLAGDMANAAARGLRKVVTSFFLGGYNPNSGMVQAIGGLLGTAKVVGWRQAVATMSLPLEYAAFTRRAMRGVKKGQPLWDLLTDVEAVPTGEGGLVRAKGIEQRVAATPTGFANKARAALDFAFGVRTNEYVKESMVEWFLSPLNQSRGAFDTAGPRRPRRKGEKLRRGLAREAAAFLPFAGEHEFALFNMGDRYGKSQLFMAAYIQNRKLGRSRELAKEMAEAALIDQHGMHHEVLRSDLMRNAWGGLLGSMTTWIQSQVGSFQRTLLGSFGERIPTPESMQPLSVPKKSVHQLSLAEQGHLERLLRGVNHAAMTTLSAYTVMALARNFLGADWSRQGGATLSQAPGGQDLDNFARQVSAEAPEGAPLVDSPIRDQVADYIQGMEFLGWFGDKMGDSLADVVRVFGGDFSKWPTEIPVPFFPGSFTSPTLEMAQAGADYVTARFRDDQRGMDEATDRMARYGLLWEMRAYRRGYMTEPDPHRPGHFLTHQMRTGRVQGRVEGEGMARILQDLLGPPITEQAEWVRLRGERFVERDLMTRDRNASREVSLAVNEWLHARRRGASPAETARLADEVRRERNEWAKITGREGDPGEQRAMTNRLIKAGLREGMTYEQRQILTGSTLEIRAGAMARALKHMPRSEAEATMRALIGKQSMRDWIRSLPQRAREPFLEAWSEASARWAAEKPAPTSRPAGSAPGRR